MPTPIDARAPGGVQLIETLVSRVDGLQKDLDAIQQEYLITYTYHGQKCVHWLQISMKGLFKVIKEVKKADKKLVNWHHRSATLKSVLRVIHIDRSTQSVVAKGTNRLKNKVSTVENKFRMADGVCIEGVDAASRLSNRLVEFSITSVNDASEEALQAKNTYDQGREQVETMIRSQKLKQNAVTEELAETSTSIEKVRSESSEAAAGRDFYALGSMGSFGLAAASSLVGLIFPPSLAATAPLLAMGAGAGSAALEYNSRVSSLEDQRRNLSEKLASHEESVAALKADLDILDVERGTHTKSIQKVEELQDKTGQIRAELQQKLSQLNIVQIVLHNIHTKLDGIIWQLEECQYAETRRDIAQRLRSILVSIHGLEDEDILSLKGDQYAKAMSALMEVDGKTQEVLSILDLARNS